MNQVEIGRFIAETRKEQNFTQKALAEQLGISDRTVSKWECGKGLPETSLMMPLCDLLHISVNELLSGCRLSEEEFPRKAEENMMNLMEERRKNRKSRIGVTIFAVLAAVCLIWILLFSSERGIIQFYYYIDILSFLTLVLFLVVILAAAGLLGDFFQAFAFVYGNGKPEGKVQLEQAYDAVKLAEKVLVYGSVFVTAFYVIALLGGLSDPTVMGANLSVVFLSILYGTFGIFLLLPVQNRLKRKSMMWQEEQDRVADTEQQEKDD